MKDPPTATANTPITILCNIYPNNLSMSIAFDNPGVLTSRYYIYTIYLSTKLEIKPPQILLKLEVEQLLKCQTGNSGS